MNLVIAALLSVGAAVAAPLSSDSTAKSTALPPPALEKIADGVWIHKTFGRVEPWGPVLSQGLVVKTAGGVLLVDTAWNGADTERLIALIAKAAGERPTLAVVTHAHDDKMGGVGALHRAGVESFAHRLTNEDAPLRGLTPAATDMPDETGNGVLSLSSARSQRSVRDADNGIVAFYPGPGHTRDNIVVYHAPSKTLFGGCLIRPMASNSLGNTADADIANWADAVRNVAAQFPDAEVVIPSHGARGGRELLDHTIALGEAATNAE